jgi:hypothetical protein
MTRDSIYTSSLGFTWTEKYNYYPGECGYTSQTVESAMQLIKGRLEEQGCYYGDLFPNYKIETWSTVRSDCPKELFPKAGLTYPLARLTRLNPNYDFAVTHEFGHEYALRCKMLDANETSQLGKELSNIYIKIRPSQCMPQEERFAEDFKYFFGDPSSFGAVGIKDTDKHAKEIIGLKHFIQACWPVTRYLSGKTYNYLQYTQNQYMMQWYTNNRWECFYLGYFYYHDGSKWVWLNG